MQLVEVIVERDDTLDHIFRRLRLSLSDLADVRALTGVQSMLDRLNPGERLKFLHRDGSLIGMERHLSLTEKLEVRRTEDGFKAIVVPKPVEIHTSTARGAIESSLFESANSAGLVGSQRPEACQDLRFGYRLRARPARRRSIRRPLRTHHSKWAVR